MIPPTKLLTALSITAITLLGSGCDSTATCTQMDFNGSVYYKWYGCSDDKERAIDCDVKDDKWTCTCKEGDATTATYEGDKWPFKGVEGGDEGKATASNDLCKWKIKYEKAKK